MRVGRERGSMAKGIVTLNRPFPFRKDSDFIKSFFSDLRASSLAKSTACSAGVLGSLPKSTASAEKASKAQRVKTHWSIEITLFIVIQLTLFGRLNKTF
jgi:hypothetical protein